MPKQKLTALGVGRLKAPAQGQADYFDIALPGFAVRVTERGAKSFVVFYRVGGKVVRETLGRVDAQAKDGQPGSLSWARTKARHKMALAQAGKDPRVERQEERRENERLRASTYAATVETFIDAYAKAKKGNRTWREQRRLLLKCAPDWHKRPVANITRRDVHEVLDRYMKAGTPYVANRTYVALNVFFKWCERRDLLTRNPMAGVEKPFDGEQRRERHWTDDEIKAIWNAADAIGGTRGAYLKALILLGQRREETGAMQWDQLDLEAATWTLPGGQTKNKREHVFPLSPLVKNIIAAQPRVQGGPYVFPGRGYKKPMNAWSRFTGLVREKSEVQDFSFHAARHTLATRLDALGVLPHVKIACLNHTPQGVTAGYSHYQYIGEQREAFNRWAQEVARIVRGEAENVLEMRD